MHCLRREVIRKKKKEREKKKKKKKKKERNKRGGEREWGGHKKKKARTPSQFSQKGEEKKDSHLAFSVSPAHAVRVFYVGTHWWW